MRPSHLLALILAMGILGWAFPVTSESKSGDEKSETKQALEQAPAEEEMGRSSPFEAGEKEAVGHAKADDLTPAQRSGGGKLPATEGSKQGQEDDGKGKDLLKKPPVKPMEETRTIKLDRRWITKQKTLEIPSPPLQKPMKPLQWKDEKQRLTCDEHVKALDRALNKARYRSVQGDSCATARYAESFLDLVGRCKKDCPDSFIQAKGYSKNIINVDCACD